MNTLSQNRSQLRLLVVIASYGEKNLEFLRRVIQQYRQMPLKTDLVVVSEAPKALGPDVEVVVGLPAKDPWSLPFAHKSIFAQRAGQYDLFAYSEDDIGLSEGHIRAFLAATQAMEPTEVPGFFRYEVASSGARSLPEVHGGCHWKPESVKARGPYTIAEFTNEHAGFYLLTQSQLKRALASGGFLRPPSQGRYGLPETAATDIYTCCGLRKVLCISVFEDFLIHHLSNRYVGKEGLLLEPFQEQIRTLMDIRLGKHPAKTLLEVEPKVFQSRWAKKYYEMPTPELLELVPAGAQHILSVGCGWGATEARLLERGAKVTALPLDSVIGAAAARVGMEVVQGTFEESFFALAGRRFDVVLITNLLHLQPQPARVLEQCCRWVSPGGSVVLAGPNFRRLKLLLARCLGFGNYGQLRRFDQSGISLCGPVSLSKSLLRAGLQTTQLRWINHPALPAGRPLRAGSATACDWLLQARR